MTFVLILLPLHDLISYFAIKTFSIVTEITLENYEDVLYSKTFYNALKKLLCF